MRLVRRSETVRRQHRRRSWPSTIETSFAPRNTSSSTSASPCDASLVAQSSRTRHLVARVRESAKGQLPERYSHQLWDCFRCQVSLVMENGQIVLDIGSRPSGRAGGTSSQRLPLHWSRHLERRTRTGSRRLVRRVAGGGHHPEQRSPRGKLRPCAVLPGTRARQAATPSARADQTNTASGWGVRGAAVRTFSVFGLLNKFDTTPVDGMHVKTLGLRNPEKVFLRTTTGAGRRPSGT